MGLFSGGTSSSSGTTNSSSFNGLDPAALGNWNTQYGNQNNFNPTVALDSNGLTSGQNAGFDQAMKTALGQFSGSYASQGFLSPQNIGSIAGSAAQQTVPQFAQLMSNNLYGNVANRQQQFGLMNNLLNQRQIARSNSTSNYNSYQKGPNAFGQSLGNSLGQWASPSTFGFGQGGSGSQGLGSQASKLMGV